VRREVLEALEAGGTMTRETLSYVLGVEREHLEPELEWDKGKASHVFKGRPHAET
jgi:hypothetical protein